MKMNTLFMVTDTDKQGVKVLACDRCETLATQAYILPIQEGQDPLGSVFYLCEHCARDYSVEEVRFKQLFVKGMSYTDAVKDIDIFKF